MDQYIDKETRNFLILFAIVTVFLIFVYPKISKDLMTLDLSNGLNKLVQNSEQNNSNQEKPTIDTTKDYKAVVKTDKGDFTIDLFEKSSPLNVSNVVSNSSKYASSTISDIQKGFLFRVDVKEEPSKKIKDEINADFLDLDKVLVKNSSFLKEQYDKNNPATKAFSPENLDKYADQSLKEFYSRELKYTYSKTLTTPKAKKYMVYLTNKGPNNNGLDFFVVMSGSAPQVDGRYTPIGQITSGTDVLDKIMDAGSGNVKIQSFVVSKE